MTRRVDIGLESPEAWDAEWSKWFARYSQGTPRLGMWLASRYDLAGMDILEIGAGSGRESRFLARTARSVTCVDFSPAATLALRASGPPQNLRALTMDAMRMDFPDAAFDFSFHKGFWSCFGSDGEAARLFREQLRVTKNTLLAIVHNATNAAMVRTFEQKAAGGDNLYRLRFFQPEGLLALAREGLSAAGVRGDIRVGKFGGADWMHRGLFRRLDPVIQGRLASLAYFCRPVAAAESLVLEVRITGR